jgi:transcriptional regulator, XRE family
MNRIKELRTREKCTQKELADLLGVTSMTISRWEKEENPAIKHEQAQTLANHFRVSVPYLLGYDNLEEEYIVFEDQLAKFRELKGISQEELSSSLKLPLTLIQEWEEEKRGYTKEQLLSLGKFFGVSPSQILGITANFDPLDDENNENELTSIYRNLTDYNKERLIIYARDLKTLEDFNKANNP